MGHPVPFIRTAACVQLPYTQARRCTLVCLGAAVLYGVGEAVSIPPELAKPPFPLTPSSLLT